MNLRPRPRLSVFIACSADGYIATSDGDLGWLEAAARPDEDYGWEGFIASVDGLAMGRGTYDHLAGPDPWPFTGKPVFVFTHRPPAPRDGVTFWSVDPRHAVAAWTELGLRRVYVDGGRLISAFLAERLVDDLTITVVPLLLGEGLRLFHGHSAATSLLLQRVRSFPSGMVSLEYTRAKERPSPPLARVAHMRPRAPT